MERNAEAFFLWLRSRHLSESSYNNYKRKFTSQLQDRLCGADLWEIFQEYNNDPYGLDSGTYAVLKLYLWFRLDTGLSSGWDPEQQGSLPEGVWLSKELRPGNLDRLALLFKKDGLLLKQLLPALLGGPSRQPTSPNARKDFWNGDKLTDFGLVYFALRAVLLTRWGEEYARRPMLDAAVKVIQKNTASLRSARTEAAAAAAELDKAWSGEPGYTGSGTQQTLKQLCSLKLSEGSRSDSFSALSEQQIFRDLAELLLKLLTGLLESNGQHFALPSIPLLKEGHEDDWMLLLTLAPFQRSRAVTELFFLKGDHYETIEEKVQGQILRLIRAGMLWLDFTGAQQHPQLKLIPCAYELVVTPDTPRPKNWWTEAYNSMQKLLRRFLDATLSRMRELWESNLPDTLDTEAVFHLSPELQLLLSAAPDGSAGNRSTLSKLVSVLAWCHFTRMEGHDADAILHSTDQLCAMAEKWPQLFTDQNRDLPLRTLSGGRPIWSPADIRLHGASRLLSEIAREETEETDDSQNRRLHKLAVFAELYAARSRDSAETGGDFALALRAGICRMDALLQQCRFSAPKSKRAQQMDVVIPCLEELLRCRVALSCFRPQLRFSAAAATKADTALTELLQAAADRYNSTFFGSAASHSYSTEEQALLRFDPEVSDEEILSLQQSLLDYTSGLRDDIKGDTAAAPVFFVPETTAQRGFHQNWYLADLDSVYAAEADEGSTIEGRLMEHMLSAQNCVLGVNQLVDNEIIRHLAHNPAFLWTLKTGRLNLSLYGNIYDLRSYAAQRLNMTYGAKNEGKIANAFQWSSLGVRFDQDDQARTAAAAYLLNPRNPLSLPSEYRELITRFSDELRILDEAIPYQTRAVHYQRQAQPNMLLMLKNAYSYLEQRGQDPLLCGFHRDIMTALGDSTSYRSDYMALLDLCRDGGKDVCLTLSQGHLLEQYHRLPHGETLLEQARFLLNDTYNRMLSTTFADYQKFTYTDWQRRLLRFDENTPMAEGGCRILSRSHTLTETGVGMDWSWLIDCMAEMDQEIAASPLIRPEHLARILDANGVAAEVAIYDKAEEVLRVRQVSLRTSQDKEVLLRLTHDYDALHMETKGDGQ